MNKLVRRGISAYKVFLKNKLAMSIMMLVSGVMMLVAGIKGTGNDTLMMPLGITIAGAVFSIWSCYKVGYVKSTLSKPSSEDEANVNRAMLVLQVSETLIYLAVLAIGIFLLVNQSFTNRVLNLMAGGFTTLNGVLGAIKIFKNLSHRDFQFWFKVILTLFELGFGLYFVLNSDNIEMGWFVAMGALTTVAGTIEVIAALTPESIRGTISDGKDIVRILKDEKPSGEVGNNT